MFWIFLLILNLDFISKRLSSNVFSEQIRLPNYVLAIFRNLCYTLRQDDVSYAYVSKEIYDLRTLQNKAKSIVDDINSGSLKASLLETLEFTELEVDTLCRNCVAQLVGISRCSDYDEVIQLCLRNLNELGKYRIISDATEQSFDHFSKICRNVLNTADDTRPLGARAYRRFKTAMVRSSTELSYSSLLISALFIGDVSLYVSAFDVEEKLGLPGPKEQFFVLTPTPLHDRMYELLNCLTSEKIVDVTLPSESQLLPIGKRSRGDGRNSFYKRGATSTVQVAKYHTSSGDTSRKIMFTVGNLVCYVNTPQEMEEVLSRLCTIQDGKYVVKT